MFEDREIYAQILALHLTSFGDLGKLLKLLVPKYSHLNDGSNTYLTGRLC